MPRFVPNPPSFRTPYLCVVVAILVMLIAACPISALAQHEFPRPPEPGVTTFVPPKVFDKVSPENTADLQAIQDHIKKIIKKVVPCTVAVRVGAAQGSGVIVSADGYILTAGHVSGAKGRPVVIIFHDGKTAKGITLGANRGIDSGMIKITDTGPWPFVEMGRSLKLASGTWCLSTGHPGGYISGRPPVVRVGRVHRATRRVVSTDCTLVGGDSGGPLFDMFGKVIGIHSRITGSLAQNLHVPVDTYHETWNRLARSEVWNGRSSPKSGGPYVGLGGDPDEKNCKIGEVFPNAPAAKAGIKVGDIITKFAGTAVKNFSDLSSAVTKQKPGSKVKVELTRDGKTISVELVIGKRP